MKLHLKLEHEPWPGERWQRHFTATWPAYRAWYLGEGDDARPDLLACRSVLELYMPELMPAYNSLCRLAGDDEVAARYLTMWCPPPYLAGCSQLAWTGRNPTLVRNYDFDPRYFDQRMRFTEYCRPVIGMQDSGWGLLDGMNADGLAAALAFGGRRVHGKGFGIPLVVRYVLETCATVEEACAALMRLPLHMSYSVTLVDKARNAATVFLNPDRAPEVIERAWVTNQQHRVEWDEYSAFTHTLARQDALERSAADAALTPRTLIERFLKPPLYTQQYFRGFGTLYTAAYDVARGMVTVVWPEKRLEAGFEKFEEQEADVVLLRPVGRSMIKGSSPRPAAIADPPAHSTEP